MHGVQNPSEAPPHFWRRPLAQDSQGLQRVALESSWYWPLSHTLHSAAPSASWKRPTAHGSSMPDWQKWPGRQYGAHAVPLATGFSPAPQSTQPPAMLALRKRPRSHALQRAAPPSLYVPPRQCSHRVMFRAAGPSNENVFVGQSSHRVAPAAAWNCPGAQGAHEAQQGARGRHASASCVCARSHGRIHRVE